MILLSTAVRLWFQKGLKQTHLRKTTLLAWQGHKTTKEVIYYCYSLMKGYGHLSNYFSYLGLLTFSQIACPLYWPLYKIDSYLHFFVLIMVKHNTDWKEDIFLCNSRQVLKTLIIKIGFLSFLFHWFFYIFLQNSYIMAMLAMKLL